MRLGRFWKREHTEIKVCMLIKRHRSNMRFLRALSLNLIRVYQAREIVLQTLLRIS